MIQERARRTAVALHVPEFMGSNAYIERFSRHTIVHKSIRLHGRGGSALPLDYLQRMEELQTVAVQDPLKNIYEMDESGLFYRVWRRKSYLAPNKDPRHARGAELQRHKSRITIVLCVKSDGSYSVPVCYVGHAAEPRYFHDNRFDEYRTHYSWQENAWMDSVQFKKWIHW